MKVRFVMTMEGDEPLDDKLKKAVEENPGLHIDLIKSFGHAVMMALRLNDKDNIKVIGFTIGRIEEDETKKVDT